MRIIVRSKETNLWLPIPLFLANTAVLLLPESVIEEIKKSLPEPYQEVINKKFLQELVRECQSVLKQYKGLEIVHVETQDGTFVSIRL
ncbi:MULTISPECIES: hypothetical protein [unclassified Clostridioides]|uniref:hypothetical protein n=1 Tax=unclassified Clostridioides TaxID=2635829 RepID=UPI001D0C31BD|nr:hypothetical protein [Clostridioides sp. ES-S-0001-03]MCC0682172.1 hypothetical protein [Clostridioides sp. ES-S-0005-03]MCC0704427.1 hypothetical protein [Clostridioides sp. ES-S-0049-02]MCC0706660.1 hypothetical protein [Clostridioides sp. ES-S-0190-01]UDN47970.1 hypothetical protein JJJ25_02565 [Clostridioides sp. ES-S-0173-01]UDN58049.1 hypothetical protein JJC01_18105 [Clostridioides sp. ES-S-0010-02]UDN62360.1 hypothetical protein IC758_02535 [Clostridioides sp. ES-W-0016-02]